MKEDRVYLLHIRDAVARIREYTKEGEQAFHGDPKTQDAVVRNLEILGEAVKQLSEPFRSGHGEIPWKIAGMRDKLIHEYFGVNLALVWDVIEHHMPRLESCVKQALGEDRPD